EDRRRLLCRLVGAEERERRRIASDVHDGPIQKLTTVGLRLEMLRARLANPEERRAVDELLQTVERSTTGLRALLFELRPPALDRDGLAVALGEYLDQVSFEGGFDHRIENRLDADPPPEVGTIAYRIAREALTNVRNHARAKSVTVLLAPWNAGLKVRIEDNGVGFDPAGAEGSSPGHLGLSDMRERAEMAGGRFSVESGPGEGTTVEFWVPAAADAHGALVPGAPAQPGEAKSPA
ncbi:MAG: sensor histidine kinase, partial [Actinobacteria bacterium]|nr:sensor histidine kinase [Actinomycetota bacterium]